VLLDRRTFAVGSAALLSGCATGGGRPRTLAGCTPLPPVKVDASRVIRTVAGLRPYRRSGFVVRAEALGPKTLVHNYGHGGAGITLSWGSSKLATDLGLPGHSGPIAVLGSGVMGLSTARLVQDAGFAVTLYTAALPPDTTSNIAGGQFHPFALYNEDSVTPAWKAQFLRALEYSWRRFQIMVGDDYGIRWLPTYDEATRPTSICPTTRQSTGSCRPPSFRSRSNMQSATTRSTSKRGGI
jgi:D-amino-acid oxidase